MTGQGSPTSAIAFGARLWRVLAIGTLWLCTLGGTLGAEPTSVRVRFEWSGPEPALLVGSFRLSGGQFSEFRLLGLDADQPGAFVNQGEQILVSPRFSTRSSGFEALLTGELDDVLRIALSAESEQAPREPISISLADILQGESQWHLDQDQLLKIRRAAGDEIRVSFPGDVLVFEPGEKIRVDVRGEHLSASPGSKLRARLRIREAGDTRVDVTELWQLDDGWTRTEHLEVGQDHCVAPLMGIDLPIPEAEGVYHLTVDFTHRLPAVGTVAKRTFPFVVVASTPSPPRRSSGATKITEFNPADPSWREYLAKLPIIPGRNRGPWSNATTYSQASDGSNWVQLPGAAWVAYALSGAKPDVPHVLEIEFPPGVVQDVGVSVIEPRSEGQLSPLHDDVGLSIGDQDLMLPGVSRSNGRTRHRIVFWPKSSSPVVTIVNRSRQRTAAFGTIRLEAFPQGLPEVRSATGSRKRMAMLDGELLQTVFDAYDRDSTPDNWESFWIAGQRLVAYLKYAGYDGATIKVVSEGSSLYPSPLLTPTAKFDGGIFATESSDPVRKDVLEMLLRLFDREQLTLLPSIEFATPLPELESILAANPAAVGIELFDVDSRRASDLPSSLSGLAPYYNPLDSRVQQAMANVVQELLDRYAHHKSLGGVHMNIHPQGYTQLPGMAWGVDEATLQKFLQSTKQEHPEWASDLVLRTLTEHLRKKADSKLVATWLAWRADTLRKFYRQLSEQIAGDGERRLFLSISDLMESEPWQRNLRPALPRHHTVDSVLLELGFDLTGLQNTPHLVLLRPNRIAPIEHLGSQAVNLEANEQDIQRAFDNPSAMATQFDYPSQVLEYEAFDERGPTRKKRHRFLATTSRSGFDARRHLALSLARHDDRWIFEGGRVFPFGQESARNAFYDVFRELPRLPFQVVELEDAGPVVVRIAKSGGETFAYFVNTSPWEAKAGIQYRCGDNVSPQPIGNAERTIRVGDFMDCSNLEVTIEPYGLLALRFDSPKVELLGCQAELPSDVAQQLSVQLDEIMSRGKQIESTEPVDLLRDPGFEQPLDGPDANWITTELLGAAAELDLTTTSEGGSALRMVSPHRDAKVRVLSHDFPAPETGRLVVSMKLRKGKSSDSPPFVLRLLSTDESYQPFHHFKTISANDFTVQGLSFVDLPTQPNLRLRISLELLGAGEVWIDDIRLFDRWILEDEKKDLTKIIMRAVTQRRSGDLAGCYQTLSGYWPRFLLRHVPPARIAARPQPLPARPAQDPPREKSRFFDLQRFVPKFRY